MRNMRKIMMTLLLFVAMAANAVQVQYFLKTHIDKRTINAGATINSFAELESKMPAKLKRAYCTYYFYKDEALTIPVTEENLKNGNVYVDYVFEPPFVISEPGDVWYYFLTTYEPSHGEEWLKGETRLTGVVSTDYQHGTSSPAASDIRKGHYEFAFYGDSYALQIQNRCNNQYLFYDSNGNRVGRRDKSYNWQMYENTTVFTVNGESHKTVSFAAEQEYGNNHFICQDWNGDAPCMNSPRPSWNGEKLTNSVYAWYLDLGMHSNSNMYKYVVYTVRNETKTLRTQTPYTDYTAKFNTSDKFPANLKKEGAEYSFYKDKDLTIPYPEVAKGAGMVVIYVKEEYPSVNYVTDHWVTMCLPYDIDDLNTEFGENAVRVLEYTGCTVNETCTRYNLDFKMVDKMVAHHPYLFKADRVLEGKYLTLYDTDEAPKESDIVVKSHTCMYDGAVHENNVNVDMIGTYDGITLSPSEVADNGEEDFIYFYFAYKASTDEYNFYKVKKPVEIKPFRCYFKIYSTAQNRGVNVFSATFNETVTGITEQIFVEPSVLSKRGIYTINGQLVRADGNDTEGLTKGIYIIDGKKVVIR